MHLVKVSDLLCSEYVVIVYLFMYYYVTFSVLLCGVAVWCIMYFWVITIICLFYFGNMFHCTDYDFVFTNNE